MIGQRAFIVGSTGLSLCLAGLAAMPLGASENCTQDAMIVFDGSGSMSEMGFNQLDEPRIFDARRALRRALPDIAATRRLGLITYGPGPRGACENIELLLEPAPGAAPAIIAMIDDLQPAGDTPLTEAVAQAAQVLGAPRRPGTVVLVTDGKETCGGAPCQLAAQLAASAPGLTVHVIGFRMRSSHFNWQSQAGPGDQQDQTVARCLAERTGGHYVTTETVDELVDALDRTLGCQVFGESDTRREQPPKG